MDLDDPLRVVTTLGSIDPSMNANQMRAILTIYRAFEAGKSEKIPMATIQKELGFTQALMSRICAYLGKTRQWSKAPGVHLIDRIENPQDTRAKDIVLTTRGRALLSQLKNR